MQRESLVAFFTYYAFTPINSFPFSRVPFQSYVLSKEASKPKFNAISHKWYK
jgi:hypothetical protein